jgi:copper chaperone CopZ
VQAALEKVDGVASVEVDFEAKTATVHCTEDTDPKALVAALEGADFGGSVKK